MRILVVGGYGLIGSTVVAHLRAAGHDLTGAGRNLAMAGRRFPDMAWIHAELGTTGVEAWTAAFRQVDAVVNCAGALQDSRRDDLDAVHIGGVSDLLAACRAAGVSRFVHVSAIGVEAGGTTAFSRSKGKAETLVQASGLDWIILRPGLVLAPAAYGGTALLRGLAALPWLVPVVHADSLVQVVSVEDVATAVAIALTAEAPRRVDLVHAELWSLERLVMELRRWLGLPPARVLRVPAGVASGAARISDMLASLGWRSPMRTATLDQLRQGIQGDAGAAARELGLELRSLRGMLDGWPSGVQERWFAKSYFLKPVMLATLFVFWFVSGLIGLTIARAAAVATLTVVGVPATLAEGAVVSGGLVDMGLALAVGFRRSAPRALQGMILVSAIYMIAGTLVRPDLWLDPLGPFLKTVPAGLLAAAALALMDER